MEYELMYHSYASAEISNEEINDIIEKAKAYNGQHNITGCIMYHNKQFVQLLEGDLTKLEELMEHISKDPRHTQVAIIHKEPIKERLFWKTPMAFDVVDKDEFEYVGAAGHDDLEFIKNDAQAGKKLFERLAGLVNNHFDVMHSKPFGPSV